MQLGFISVWINKSFVFRVINLKMFNANKETKITQTKCFSPFCCWEPFTDKNCLPVLKLWAFLKFLVCKVRSNSLQLQFVTCTTTHHSQYFCLFLPFHCKSSFYLYKNSTSAKQEESKCAPPTGITQRHLSELLRVVSIVLFLPCFLVFIGMILIKFVV